MADVEKVVNGLECCGRNNVKYCRDCPYWPEMDCVEKMAADALGLIAELKAQIHGLTEQIANGGGNG